MRQSNVAYRKFTDEEIRRANSVDIVSLARSYGYEPEQAGRKAIHMKHSGGLYLFPDSNRFYHWTGGEADKKGGSIDFVMREENLPFTEAVAKLIGESYTPYTRRTKPYTPKPKEPLVLPVKADNFKRAYAYLVSARGIEPEIVSHFMNEKKIYQEAKYGNCVFVGYDKDGTAKYCAMRGTMTGSKFKMDAENSDKSFPFFYEGKSDLVIVNEAPIDLMSHATLMKLSGGDWRQDHRISLGCIWDGALERYLGWHPEIKRIVFAYDNDYLARNKDGQRANWGQLSADKHFRKYTEKGYACAVHIPHLNDFNQDLVETRKGRTPEDMDRQRMTELQAEFEKDAVDEPEPESEDDELEP
jgi:hypothetical protein